MSVTCTYAFTNTDRTIKLVKSCTDIHGTKTTTTKFNKNNTSITIGNTNNLFEISDLRGSACIEYGDITAPASTGITDLCDIINGWLNDPIPVDATVVIPPGISTEAKQDTQIANQSTIIGHIDGLEALLTSIDGKVATEVTLAQIEGHVDGLEALLTSIDGKVATETTLAAAKAVLDNLLVCCNNIDNNTDTLEALITDTNAKLDTIITNTTGLAKEAKQDTQITNQGTEGATPPTIAGTGIIGYLRAIFDRLAQTFAFTGDRLKVDANITGSANAPILIFGTTTPLLASATFASGILSLVGKSQVETRVTSDTDGTLIFDFYEDAGGTDLVRSLSIPYVGGSGYQYFAAPAFSNYVEYSFVNSGTPQTDFLYETKVLTTAISGQIVRLDGTIVDGMVAPVTRSVLTGQTSTGDFVNQGMTTAGNAKVSIFDSQSGFPNIVDPNGSIKVGETIVLCGSVLDGSVLSSFLWQELSINGGTRTGGQGEQTLSTGTNPDGGYILQSLKKARFIITQFNINHLGIQLLQADLEDPNTVFEWGSVTFLNDAGAINPTPNGTFMRVTGAVPPTDPTWEIVSVKDGVETVVDSSLWNGVQSSLLNKRPSLSVYETRYNAGTALFYQGANFLHRLISQATYSAVYDFPVALRIRNINGNSTNRSVATRALGTYRLGEERGELISRALNVSTLLKTGAGYVGTASLSRTGGGGGNSGIAIIYDGINNGGIPIGRIDVSTDDVKGVTLNGTFSNGLYVEIIGAGTNTLTINFE